MRRHREQNKGIRKKKVRQPIHSSSDKLLKYLYWDTEAEELDYPDDEDYLEYLENKYK